MTQAETLKRAMHKGRLGIELTPNEWRALRKAESRLPQHRYERLREHVAAEQREMLTAQNIAEGRRTLRWFGLALLVAALAGLWLWVAR